MRFEPIHAVTYFSPESITAAKESGLKGFWMGYFGFRAAPLGSVSAGVVEATFANFDSARVNKAVPDCWSLATPEVLIEARATSAAAALRTIAPSIETVASNVNETLTQFVRSGDHLGRPLFAANRALDPRADSVEQLWQLCTSLREHRGDGHVDVLAAEGVSGPAAHILLAADSDLTEELFLMARGFEKDHWATEKQTLNDRGLLDGDAITERGRTLRAHIEHRTDDLAAQPLRGTADSVVADVMASLEGAAREIQSSGAIPAQNPIGLPPLT